jgi:Ca2+-transporting ATPase
LREQFPVPEKRVVWPFSSKKKRMSSLLTVENGFRLHCKGASEVVLELCDQMLNSKGEAVDISSEKDNFRAMIDEWAGMGYRTLSIAYSEYPSSFKLPKSKAKSEGKDSKEEITEGDKQEDTEFAADEDEGPLDHNLILIGIVGIEDPVRKEVPDSVATCQRAGITVRMLTGDNILTAKQIAKQCGILKEDGIAIEGPKFRTLSTDEIDKIIPKLQVIARCSPEDKLILVKRLRQLGEVVAVTGDGTNDAPILKEADVGFAMGISGTDVAKDASDIILLDDNFSSIEKAVLWGRNVYDSIRKFLQFQLTVNIVAVLVAFIGAVTTGESPLKAVQLLWVNLIMDTFAALALATEPPTPDLMNRPPYGRYAPLITYRMWRAILGQAFFQLFVCLFTLYGAQTISFLEVEGSAHEVVTGNQDDKRRNTIVFNTFVICQLFNEINARKLGSELNMFKGIQKNWIFVVIFIGSFVVQFILVQFAGDFAKTVALTGYQWLFCIFVGMLALPLGLLFRLIPVPPDVQNQNPLVSDLEDSPRGRTALENWKVAREGILGQHKGGFVSAIRRTHHRGHTTFGASRNTKNYTFMEY